MSSYVEHLGWVLVHSLWQFALLAAVAFATQLAMRRASAMARYAMLLSVLAAMVIAPAVTWQLVEVREVVATPVEVPLPAAPRSPVVAIESLPPVAPTHEDTAATPVFTPVAASPTTPQPTVQIVPEPLLPSWGERVRGVVTPWLFSIVWGWSLGVVVFALRPLVSWFTVRKLRTVGVSAAPTLVESLLMDTMRRLGITRVVRVLQSTVVQVPIVAGYLKPVILLPASIVTGLSSSQLEAILAHELAHIRRHDYLVNLGQTLVETIFFYHPAVWWLSHQIRCERENCCDDIAVSVVGNRLDYSRALLALEELRGTPTPLALGANGGSLLSRVRRLFGSEPTPDRLPNGSIAIGATLVAGVLAIAALAGTEGTKPSKETLFSGPLPTLQSWPQLGGSSSRNSVSPVTHLPIQFDLAKSENIRWKADIGNFSFNSPVVSGGKVLIGTNNSSGAPGFPQLELVCLLGFDVARWHCFDEQTGQLLWQYESQRIGDAALRESPSWPGLGLAGTPCIEGDRVWLATNRNEIVCLDLNGLPVPEASAPGVNPSPAGKTHPKIIWKFDLRAKLGTPPMNATCGSPTIAGELVLFNTSNDVNEIQQKVAAPNAPSFFALNKLTGELVWSSNAPGENILGGSCPGPSPAVGKIGDTWQAVFAGLDGWIYSYELAALREGRTELLWKFDVNLKESVWTKTGKGKRNLPATPVIWNDKVLVATGHNPEHENRDGHLWCIDATKRGDLSMELVYNKSAPDVVIPHKRTQACEPDKGDFTRTNPNQGIAWSYQGIWWELEGERPFEHVLHRTNSLPVVHDGLVIISDMSGIVHCLDATTGTGYWTHDLLAACWSTPLIADGKIWVTSDDGVSVFALAKQKQLLAKHNLGSSSYSTPAAANQTLYLATETQLIAVGSGAFPQPEALVAKLSGGIEIELAGITRNTAPAYEGWRPDGSPMSDVEGWKVHLVTQEGETTHTTTENDPRADRDARDLLLHLRGLKGQRPSIFISTPSGSVSGGQWMPNDDPFEIRLPVGRSEKFMVASAPGGPLKKEVVLNTWQPQLEGPQLTIGITVAPWGAPVKVRPDGVILNPPQPGDRYAETYKLVEVLRADTTDGSWITIRQPPAKVDPANRLHAYDFEFYAIDTEGGRHTTDWRAESPNGKYDVWFNSHGLFNELPDGKKLSHFEYRVRPYRDWVTFSGLAMEPGKMTKAKVIRASYDPPQDAAEQKPLTAKLPGGLEIELVGVTKNTAPAGDGWNPDGSPMGKIDEWPGKTTISRDENGNTSIGSGHGGKPHPDARDLLVEMRGLQSQASYSLLDITGARGWSNFPVTTTPFRNRLGVLLRQPAEKVTFRLAITDEPWGPWQQVGTDGQLLNQIEVASPEREHYEALKVLSCGANDKTPAEAEIVLEVPLKSQEQYVFEIRAMTSDGKELSALRSLGKISENGASNIDHYITWDRLPVEKIARWEYRLRPYRHFVKFEDVSFEPGKSTAPKVSVESVPVADVKPMAANDDPTTQPPKPDEPVVPRVELIGLTDDKSPKTDAWQPNGSPMAVPEWVKAIPGLATPELQRSGAKLFLYEFHGLRTEPSLSYTSGIVQEAGDEKLPQDGPFKRAILYGHMVLGYPTWGSHPAIRLSDEPWGPWQTVTKEGQLAEPLQADATYRAGYEKVSFHGVRPLQQSRHNGTPLPVGIPMAVILRQPQLFRDEYDIEIETASTGDGSGPLQYQPLTPRFFVRTEKPPQFFDRFKIGTTKVREDEFDWPIDPAQIDHLRFRIRPYRHRFEFQNVNYDPSQKPSNYTEFKTVYKKLEHDLPQPVAPRVELIGLTYDTVAKTEAWRPNGGPMALPEWAQSLPELAPSKQKTLGPPIYLYEFHGLKTEPSVYYHDRVAFQAGDNLLPQDGPLRKAILYAEFMPPEEPELEWPKTISLSDEPWGPWRNVTKEGQLAEPQDGNETYRLGYDRVTFHGVRPLTMSGYGKDPLPLHAPMGIVQHQRQYFRNLYVIEVEAAMAGNGTQPPQYQSITPRFFVRFQNESTKQWNYEFDWPIDPAQIDHLRFRIRPYRHRFEFQNVNYDPSQKPSNYTQFKTVYTKLEHDLPQAVGAVDGGMEIQVVDAETNQPVQGAVVAVRQTISEWQPDPPKSQLYFSEAVSDSKLSLETDTAGRFGITVPAAMRDWRSELQVSVRHAEYAIEQSFGSWQITPQMIENPALAKEKLFGGGVIKLKRGHEISGQVLGPQGKPASGVSLYAAMQMPEYLNMPPHAVTDDDGRYKFRVPSHDQYRLFLISPDAVSVSIPIRKEYGEHPPITLEHGTAIRGQVFGADGKPLADVVVQGNGSDSVYTGFPNPMARVETDAEGRYTLPPMKLPVDVRLSPLGWVGGWSSHGRILGWDEVYLPVLVRGERGETSEKSQTSVDPPSTIHHQPSLTLDFKPAETVTLTAHIYDDKGLPATDADIAVLGEAPDPERAEDENGPFWRGRFQPVANQPGQFQVKAPKGLQNVRLVHAEIPTDPSQPWTRAVREGEKLAGPRTDAGWGVLDQDDASIVVGAALQPAQPDGQPVVSAPSETQTPPMQRTVTLSVKDTPAKDVLSQIAQQAGLKLELDLAGLATTDWDPMQPLTLQLHDAPLSEAVANTIGLFEISSDGPYHFISGDKLVVTSVNGWLLYRKQLAQGLPEWVRESGSRLSFNVEEDGKLALHIYRGPFTADEFSQLASLPMLTNLNLDLSVEVDDASLSVLSQLKDLRQLELTNTFPPHFRAGRADLVLAHIQKLPNLRELTFIESGATDAGFRHLLGNKTLESLVIYQDGGLSDGAIEVISQMTQLRTLSIMQYVFIKHLPKMAYSADSLARLSALTNLQNLTVIGFDVPAEAVASTGLTRLGISGTTINDAAAVKIAACRGLRSLTLSGTRISDEGLRLIAEGTVLNHLSLSRNAEITDAGLAHLHQLPLHHIEISASRLTDAAFPHLAKIKSLSRIDITASRNDSAFFNEAAQSVMTIEGLRVLEELPKLRTLWISGFSNNSQYTALTNMQQLRELNIWMSLTNLDDLEMLERALPHTRITAGTGGGSVDGFARQRAVPLVRPPSK